MNAADYWDSALEIDDYVRSMTQNQSVFAEQIEATVLSAEQYRLFAEDPVRILVLTEDFCGDSAQFIPPVARLARESDSVDLRVLRRDEHRDLASAYRRPDNYQAIPVFIVLAPDGEERGFVIERPQIANAEMAAETRRFAAEHSDLEGIHRTYDRMPVETRAAVRANVERYRQTRTADWVAALFNELAIVGQSKVAAPAAN